MKKSVFYVLLVLFIGVFAFSAYKLGSYWMEKVRSDQALKDATAFVDVVPSPNNGEDGTQDAPEKIEIDGLYVHRIGVNYIFNNVNPNHILPSYDAKHPVVPPEEITVKDFSCLFFGDVYTSVNIAMFPNGITK